MAAPILIRIFSGLFVFLGFVAAVCLGLAWAYPVVGGNLSIGFLTAKIAFSENPFLYTALSLLFVFAGVVGVCILFRRRYAYDVAIVYAGVSILFLGALAVLGIGQTAETVNSLLVLGLTLGWFLHHLIRRRTEWKRVQTLV